MYKLMLVVFAALVAIAAANKQWELTYGSPLAYSYGSPVAYSAPVAPVAYGAYGSYGAYGYGSPVVSAYPYAAAPVAYATSPYSYFLKR